MVSISPLPSPITISKYNTMSMCAEMCAADTVVPIRPFRIYMYIRSYDSNLNNNSIFGIETH